MAPVKRGGGPAKGKRGGGAAPKGKRGGRGGGGNKGGREAEKAKKPAPPPLVEISDSDIEVDEEDIEFFREYGAHASFLQNLDPEELTKQTDKGKVIRPERADDDQDMPDIGSSDEDDDNDGDEDDDHDDDDDDDEDDLISSIEQTHRATTFSTDEAEPKTLPIKAADGTVIANKRKLVIDEETMSPVQLPTKKLKALERAQEQREARRAASQAKVEAQKKTTEKQDDGLDEGSELTEEQIAEYMSTPSGRRAYLLLCRERIAAVAAAVTQNPEGRIDLLSQLRQLCKDKHPTVRQLAMLSLAAIFKDILPGYRIRELTEAEKAVKVSADVAKLRKFENSMLKYYQGFLQECENALQAHRNALRRANGKEHDAATTEALEQSDKVATTAMQCLCEMLVSKTNFNFRSNLLASIVARLAVTRPAAVAEHGLRALRTVFEDDEHGDASLEAVRVIFRYIKSRSYNVPDSVLNLFLHLRLIDDLEPPSDEGDKDKKGKNKQKKEHMSRKKRKLTKEEKQLERDIREAEAEVDREERDKLHTETLKIVFQTYFKIIKHMRQSPLLPTVLEGLSKFAHLINIEFMSDLLVALRAVAADENVPLRSALYCVITAFRVSSGQGEALMLDMKDFYYVLYRMLLLLPMGSPDDVELALTAILTTLHQMRTMSTTRVASFVKRMVHVATQLEPHAALALLAVAHRVLDTYPRVAGLLDTEQTGNGVYRFDIDDPDLAAPFASALWDLAILQQHVHPTVAKLASRIARSQPGMQGTPAEIFRLYRWTPGDKKSMPPAPPEHPFERVLAKQPGRTLFLLPPEARRPFVQALKRAADAADADVDEYAERGGLQGHFVANTLQRTLEADEEREAALARAVAAAKARFAERANKEKASRPASTAMKKRRT